MTSWKGHLLIGTPLTILAIILLYIPFKPELTLWFWAFCLVSPFVLPLLMDIDHQSSKMTHTSVSLGLVMIVIGIFTSNNNLIKMSTFFTIVSHFISMIFKHRGFIHSIVFILIIGVGLILLHMPFFYIYVVLAGMYTHLIGDALPIKLI